MAKSLIRRNTEKSKSKSQLSFGFISLFLVMIVLCLTVFSLLSFSTAHSDYKLTIRSTKTILSYYNAEAELQKSFAEIHSMCANGKTAHNIANELNEKLNISSENTNTLVVTQAVSDRQYIEAVLTIADNNYTINSYLLKTQWESTETE